MSNYFDGKPDKRIKIDQDLLLEFNKHKTARLHNIGMYSDVQSDCNLESDKRNKFSCWDLIDPEWLRNASEQEDARVYVHGEILEWIVEQINNHLLNRYVRASVEEVFHHNLDGLVYLIKFYQKMPFRAKFSSQKIQKFLEDVKNLLKYRLAWKSKPTYFLRFDSDFEPEKNRITRRLERHKLHNCLKATLLDVNWLYIPKIVIFEYLNDLEVDQVALIDTIFQEMSKSRATLYICEQFKWHNEGYVEMDTLAMDICAGEWRQQDLLKDFTVEDILRLDLANKDYRDPFLNDYLERYLNILLERTLPELAADCDDKLEFPLEEFDSVIGSYFISRFHNKILILSSSDKRFANFVYTYDIPIIEMSHEVLVLDENGPTPEDLIKMKYHTIEYIISTYPHFSDSLFRTLLNNSNEHQKYNFKFDKEFRFEYETDEKVASRLADNFIWTANHKKVILCIDECCDERAAKFVEYMINLFNERKSPIVKVALCFTSCVIDDFTFLENIGDSIDYIDFNFMTIPSGQIKILSKALAQIKRVTFLHCHELTDNDVMTLLENIELDDLWVVGSNACTPALHFLLAEHIMNKEGVKTKQSIHFNETVNVTTLLDDLEFHNVGDQIVARDHQSKEIVDIYCLLNDIEKIETDDLFSNIYS